MPIGFDHVDMSSPSLPMLGETGEPSPVERYRAARVVASVAADAQECASLLDMLGLCAQDGLLPLPAARQG